MSIVFLFKMFFLNDYYLLFERLRHLLPINLNYRSISTFHFDQNS